MQPSTTQSPAVEQDLSGLVHQVALADWLALTVVLLYQLVPSHGGLDSPVGLGAAAFGAICIVLRLPQLPAVSAAVRLELTTWAMTLFIAFVAWHTGGGDSPLQSLYLLPIVLGALVLSPTRLGLLVASIATAYAAAAALSSGEDVASAAFAGRLIAVLAPLAIVAWLTAQLGAAALSARRHAQTLSENDPLTELVHRRPFLRAVHAELGSISQSGRACGALVLDLEGLRRLNELYGYEAGNAALRLVAEALKRSLRETDLACRWGGDEFAVLLPGADLASTQATAQRIRNAVNSATLEVAGKHLRCAISIGCAGAPRDGRDREALFASAERRLERDRELRRAPAGIAASG